MPSTSDMKPGVAPALMTMIDPQGTLIDSESESALGHSSHVTKLIQTIPYGIISLVPTTCDHFFTCELH